MFGASGAGGESQRQLGCVIIGGMSLGTVFTVFIVPIVYTLLTSKKLKKNTFIDDDVVVKPSKK
jgi:multidrug efflux pump